MVLVMLYEYVRFCARSLYLTVIIFTAYLWDQALQLTWSTAFFKGRTQVPKPKNTNNHGSSWKLLTIFAFLENKETRSTPMCRYRANIAPPSISILSEIARKGFEMAMLQASVSFTWLSVIHRLFECQTQSLLHMSVDNDKKSKFAKSVFF